jgi:hypothetical protein
VDPAITNRLARRLRADFAEPDSAIQLLEDVESGTQDRERVVAAVVLGACGDLERLHQLVELSRIDWRDILVGVGLGNADWSHVLDERLGVLD